MLGVHAIFLSVSLLALVAAQEYPTCGSCWCVPRNSGSGPCPLWEPQTNFSAVIINTYLSQTPRSIYHLNCNPYEDADCTTIPKQDFLDSQNAVCAFLYPELPDGSLSCSEYDMVSFPDRDAAETAGAVVTHGGACGLCSTAQDLALYLSMSSVTFSLFFDF